MSGNAARRMLLVVDVQNDFCPGGALAVEHGDEVVDVVNRISARFLRVVATQDWHPADHVSFASSHPGRKILETVEAGGVVQVLWPDHCVQGTQGAQLHPRLDQRPVGLIVRKGMASSIDSYSAFFENDGKTPTGLSHYVQGLGVTEVFVCGLATDYCVLASALDARALGVEVFLVADACRGVDQPTGSVKGAIAKMEKAGVRVVQSGEIPHLAPGQ